MASRAEIEAVLERQVRFWDLRRRLDAPAAEFERRSREALQIGPYVTVSRQLGSGGRDLCRALAERLEWQVFDREILLGIAEHTQAQETVLANLDEHAIGPMNDYLSLMMNPEIPGRLPFLREMVKVVWALACKGNAIILGRGANWFLEPQFGLRVRLIAPHEQRVARLTSEAGVGAGDAARRIAQHDNQQAGFIRQVYGREIDDPTGYDVVLNLGALDRTQAVEICRDALLHKLARVRSGGTAVADEGRPTPPDARRLSPRAR